DPEGDRRHPFRGGAADAQRRASASSFPEDCLQPRRVAARNLARRNSWNFPAFCGIVPCVKPRLERTGTRVSMTSLENTAEPEAWFKRDRDRTQVAVGGAWTIAERARLDKELAALKLEGPVAIDASKISRMDSAGAWLLLRTRRALDGAKASDLRLPELY